MGRKTTKKIAKITLIVVAIIIALDLLLVGLIMLPPIQTRLVAKITASLSEKWGSTISMRSVRITPTLKIVVDNFVIQDLQHNDMITASTVSGRLRNLKLAPLHLDFHNLKATNAQVLLTKYKGSNEVNISAWARKLKNPNKKTSFKLTSDRLILQDSRFYYWDKNKISADSIAKLSTIDYGFFELKKIQFDIKNFIVKNDSIAGFFNQLAFKQYGGFEMKKGRGDFSINSTRLSFNQADFCTPNSRLHMDLTFNYSNWQQYGQFVDSINIDATVRASTINTDDIAYFAPSLKGMNNTIVLNGNVTGQVNDFILSDFYARFGILSHVYGDYAFKNILHFREMGMMINMNDINLNTADLENFSLPGGKKVPLSATVKRIENARLYGIVEGTFDNLNVDFTAETSIGTFGATLQTFATTAQGTSLQASLHSDDFNFGKLINKSDRFGTIAFSTEATGTLPYSRERKPLFSSLKANITGIIHQISFLRYPLSDIRFAALYQNRKYDASVSSPDTNCQFSFSGLIDLTRHTPNLQSYISFKRFVPGKLLSYLPPVDSAKAKGLDKLILFAQRHPTLRISFDSLMFNVAGAKLEGLNGFVGVDGISISNEGQHFESNRLRFTAINTATGFHKFILTSGFMNASLSTNYPLNGVVDSLINVAYHYFPNLLPEKHPQFPGLQKITSSVINNDEAEKYFSLSAETFRTNDLLSLIYPKLRLRPNATVDIYISSLPNKDNVAVNIPSLRYNNVVKINNFSLTGKEDTTHKLLLNLACDSVVLISKSSTVSFSRIDLSTTAQNNQIQYTLRWLNPKSVSVKPSLLQGTIVSSDRNNVQFKIKESFIHLKEDTWSFNNSNSITLHEDVLIFDNVAISNSKSSISVDGRYSSVDKDKLTIDIRNFDFSIVNDFIDNLSFEGDLSATFNVQNMNQKRFVYGKLFASDFIFNKEKLGNLFLVTAVPDNRIVQFGGGLFNSEHPVNSSIISSYNINSFQSESQKLARVNGSFDPGNRSLKVHADIDTLKIGFLSPFLASFSDHISGTASGSLTFISRRDSTYFDGVVNVKEVSMGIAPLGTSYIVKNQKIFFNRHGIEFDSMALSDRMGNTAYLDGHIHHHKFKDFLLDLSVTTDRIEVLNTVRTAESSFYGNGFVSGIVTIQGKTDKLYFKGSHLRTLSGSKLYFPITSSESISESGNIRFKTDASLLTKQPDKKSSSTNLDFDFVFDVTKDAEVQVDIYSIGGTLRGKTKGTLHLTYNKETNLNLYGNLEMESGLFLLSLKDILNAKFNIAPGGTINFNGPISDFTVAISAFYGAKASLASIISQEESSTSLSRVPVNAYLNLSGELMKSPNISFSFELPNSTPELNNLFFSAIDTTNRDNVSNQFFYFVFSNQFLPVQTDASTVKSGFESSGVGLLTSMVNNFISQQFKHGDFGIVYKERKATEAAEYGINANVPFLNDRFVFETNVGYYDNRNTTQGSQGLQDFYGDFSLEYLINEQGNWKVKVYNFNDRNAVDENKPNTGAGVALIFRQEFNTKQDIINSFKKKEKKKQNTDSKNRKK